MVYAMAEHCDVLLTHRDTKTIGCLMMNEVLHCLCVVVLRGVSDEDEIYDILAVNEFESNR